MQRIAVPIVLLWMLVLAGGWLALGGETPRAVEGATAGVARANTTAVDRGRSSFEPGQDVAVGRGREAARAERDAVRRRILDALEARGRTPTAEGREPASAPDEPEARARKARGAETKEEAPAPGGLIDRTGEHRYLMKVMNEELMPLADECHALARGDGPELPGELVLDFEILGDADIGGVVEAVRPGKGNQLDNPTLFECMQESILATTLPPPPKGGRDEVSLHLRLGPDEPK